MKTGSTQFQSHLKDLSKGITTTAEDMKKRTEEEKHKMLFDSADEEKARWKERRDAETERELAKIQEERRGKKKVVVEEPKKVVVVSAEDFPKDFLYKAPAAGTGKATAAPAAPAPSFATVPKVPAAPAQAAAAPTAPKVPVHATAAAAAPAAPLGAAVKKDQNAVAPVSGIASMEKPKIPKNDNVINEDTYDLFQALGNATNLRKTDSPSPKPGEPEKPSKRYAARRKTQEIVNESVEPKVSSSYLQV
ncbi:hypothetical protein ANCCEY_11723 [Ancylostoma ceylanicum]|uniref:Uncharacterized protein n=1 Tax=Ancylostoma ceylanicum TaxID=53326 RepID=A0A0D6LD54_9BILA|nr:hypothetical protein ANCCEY_11723 [Ancylostoma ceylanicum]